MTRRKLVGTLEVEQALTTGVPVGVLLYDREARAPEVLELVERARKLGIELWSGGAGDLRRMSPESRNPAPVLALAGPAPTATLPELLDRGGVTWLLHRAAYPSNVGFTIRTAEVSGADGVVVDGLEFNRDMRSRASHVSMGADRVMPVLYATSEALLDLATARGLRVVAIEDVGDRAPHEVELTGPLVLVVGNEREGIAADVLSRCDAIVRIPMRGFVPSYSLQAAVAMVAGERLRQLATQGSAG